MGLSELEQLLLLCKRLKVKRLEQSGIVIEFSDLAFVEEYTDALKETNLDSKKLFVDDLSTTKKEDEEDLYWSSST